MFVYCLQTELLPWQDNTAAQANTKSSSDRSLLRLTIRHRICLFGITEGIRSFSTAFLPQHLSLAVQNVQIINILKAISRPTS